MHGHLNVKMNLITLYKDSRFHIVSSSGVRAKLFYRALKTLLMIKYAGKELNWRIFIL